MKKILISLGLLIATGLSAQENYLLGRGSSWKQIALIEKESVRVLWNHELGEGQENNALTATSGGNVLYSYGRGAKLINLKHEVAFDTGIPSVHSQYRQAIKSQNGTYLVPLMGKKAIIELNAQGVELN